jgi:serpin B
MNKKHTLLWFAAALTLLGCANIGSAQDAKVEGKATVRSVQGTAQYSDGDRWLDAKPNTELAAGATLHTGSASELIVSVNGLSSAIHLRSHTTLLLQKMTRTGPVRGGETETILDLKSGTIIGQVRKVSANSRYEIQTPNGVAGIRGTDFMIEAVPQQDGSFRVTFTSIIGTVVCAATVEGQTVTRIVNAGEFWTPGDKANGHLRPPGEQGVSGTNAAPAPPSPGETKALQKTASAYNAFGFQLLNATSKSYPKTNIFLSPLGAAFALAMARNGARGATQEEITRALRLEDLPSSGIDQANEKMLDYLSSLVGLRLEIANGLWTHEDAQIKPGFIANARNFYNSEARSLDLHGPTAIGEINAWVNTHTHGTIPSIIHDMDPSNSMVLGDAIYFKALWEGPFDKELTQDKPFKLDRGGKISHPRMTKTGDFPYYETHAFQMVALPYKGSATMYVMLPKGSLEKFVRRLTLSDWEKWIASLKYRKGLLELPRFKLNDNYGLNKPLQALGIRKAFQEKAADFGGIADQPSHISQVEQKTYVDVNEEGTEAAAVTMEINMMIGIGKHPKEPPPFKMSVDHPFFIVIRENLTGAILFMGAITDPR